MLAYRHLCTVRFLGWETSAYQKIMWSVLRHAVVTAEVSAE